MKKVKKDQGIVSHLCYFDNNIDYAVNYIIRLWTYNCNSNCHDFFNINIDATTDFL